MKMKTFKITAGLMFFAGFFLSCEKKNETFDVTRNVTGTVIGSYFHGGVGSLLVQVDKKYPIGKVIEYKKSECLYMIDGKETYKNMIQVQPFLPLSDLSEWDAVIGKRISFSYRDYKRGEEGEEGDYHLFVLLVAPSIGLCTFPEVPIYVITDCKTF